MKKKLSPRLALVIIAALFLLPLLLAWFMYSGTIDFKPGKTRNLGTLVVPPLPTSWNDTHLINTAGETRAGDIFDEHWVVLFAVPATCPNACIEQVTALRQIHRASGRHQSRIRIALLMAQESAEALHSRLKETYTKFELIKDPSGILTAALERAGGQAGSVYLIDPLGNIMMTYKPGADPNDLNKDLKRLLTWSKLDEQ